MTAAERAVVYGDHLRGMADESFWQEFDRVVTRYLESPWWNRSKLDKEMYQACWHAAKDRGVNRERRWREIESRIKGEKNG